MIEIKKIIEKEIMREIEIREMEMRSIGIMR